MNAMNFPARINQRRHNALTGFSVMDQPKYLAKHHPNLPTDLEQSAMDMMVDRYVEYRTEREVERATLKERVVDIEVARRIRSKKVRTGKGQF